MKKLFSILCLTAMTLICVESQSQTAIRLKSGLSTETISASATLYTQVVNLNTSTLQAVTIQCATDSVSGTPDPKYVLQRSVDGVHWFSLAGDTLTPAYIGVNSVNPSTSAQLTINPFYGAYARIKIYTSGTTQRSKMWIALRAAAATVRE